MLYPGDMVKALIFIGGAALKGTIVVLGLPGSIQWRPLKLFYVYLPDFYFPVTGTELHRWSGRTFVATEEMTNRQLFDCYQKVPEVLQRNASGTLLSCLKSG